MARKLVVELVGDESDLLRSFRRSSEGADKLNRSLDRSVRGAIAGSGAFRSLGRSVAFASTSFLGGVGIAAAITSTIKAAQNAETVLKQTQVAVRNSGESWALYGQRIQEAALAQSKLSGFDDERLLQTFSNLVRRTQNVNQALRLNALAADVARGRNIALEQASNLVLKASIGQAGALRRLGIDAQKGATSTQLLTLLQRKYAGAAQAYGRTAAGAQDRFRVAIENLQEAIGAGLLPTITRVLNRGADWLNNTQNQQRVLSVLKQVIADVTGVIEGMVAAIKVLAPILQKVVDLLGGFKQVAIALVGLKIASWATGVAKSFGLIQGAAAGAAGAQGVGGLLASLSQLAGIVAAGFTIGGVGSSSTSTGGVAFGPQDIQSQVGDLTAYYDPIDKKHHLIQVKKGEDAKTAATRDFDKRHPGVRAAPTKALASMNASLRIINDTLAEISAGFAAGEPSTFPVSSSPSATDAAGRTSTTVGSSTTRRSAADIRRAREEAARARRAAEQRAREIRAAQRNARQFRALGLTTTGDEPVAGVRQLRRALGAFEKTVEGTFLDTKKTQSVISRIRKVLSGGLGLVGRDVRQRIQEILADLNRQLKDHATQSRQLSFRQADTSALLAGLGLSPAEIRALRARLARVNGGRVPAEGTGAFGFAVGGNGTIVINHTTTLDGRTIEQSTTKHQQRRRKRNPSQRRGRFAGGKI